MTIGELIGSPKPGVYKSDEFSHKELLEITGITPETLFTWYKRGHLAEAFHGTAGRAEFDRNPKPGRGNRRRYSFIEMAIVVEVYQLAALGLPLAAAVRNTQFPLLLGFMGAVDDVHAMAIGAGLDVLRAKSEVYAVWKADRQSVPATWHEAGYSWGILQPNDTIQELHQWLTADGPAAFRFVDVTAIAVKLIRRTARVRGANSQD